MPNIQVAENAIAHRKAHFEAAAIEPEKVVEAATQNTLAIAVGDKAVDRMASDGLGRVLVEHPVEHWVGVGEPSGCRSRLGLDGLQRIIGLHCGCRGSMVCCSAFVILYDTRNCSGARNLVCA